MVKSKQKGKGVKGGAKNRAPSSKKTVHLLLGAVVVLLFALVLSRGPAPVSDASDPAFNLQEIPKAGTHTHAPYEIVVCGEKKPPLGQTMARTGSTIHTHADGVIHLELGPDADGRRATLQNFIVPAGGLLTNDSFQYPGEEKIWKNGDLCPDGHPGRVKISIGGKESPFGPLTIPKGTPEAREENSVHIEFG